MCLFDIKKINPKKNIICYKVCYFNRIKECYNSVFMYYNYSLGKTIQIDNQEPFIYKNTISKGAFHTFKRLSDAKRFAFTKQILLHFINATDREVVILKCIIPKESKYIYEGKCMMMDNVIWSSYASQQLYINSVIKVR